MSFPSGLGKEDYVIKENNDYCCWYCNEDLKTCKGHAKHLRTRHKKVMLREYEGNHNSTSSDSESQEDESDIGNLTEDEVNLDNVTDNEADIGNETDDEAGIRDVLVAFSRERIISALQGMQDQYKDDKREWITRHKVTNGSHVCDESKMLEREKHKEVPNFVSAKGKEIATTTNEKDKEDSDE
ncbi:uncharacterized protein G2W53_004988 [Senna tora]|uniref:Uncharacterized protein n=1 Tax=Senna tora TaxID=362788 RepID=A0A834XDZ8_9FABA|nr:uncharacterized protein G2W53_004988 [Senna tora]